MMNNDDYFCGSSELNSFPETEKKNKYYLSKCLKKQAFFLKGEVMSQVINKLIS